MAEATPALEIRDLHKRYGDLEVIKGISLTARDGDVISILGSSGSGKSTFLRCINLLENPHKGQIILSGEELKLKPAKNGDLVAADSKLDYQKVIDVLEVARSVGVRKISLVTQSATTQK